MAQTLAAQLLHATTGRPQGADHRAERQFSGQENAFLPDFCRCERAIAVTTIESTRATRLLVGAVESTWRFLISMVISQKGETMDTIGFLGAGGSKEIARIALSDETRDRIQARLAVLPNPEGRVDEASAQLYRAFAELPESELQTFLDFGRHTDMPGVMLVENLPVDPTLPPTPNDGGPSRDKSTFVSEGVLLGLSGLLGEVVSFLTEKDGRAVHDVVPVAAGATTQTSQGSIVNLNFHNDLVHDEQGHYDVSNPDFLVLNCLRPDPEKAAMTVYADGRDLLGALDPDTVATLRKPLFRLNAPGGYTRMFAGGKQVLSVPVPIVSGPDHAPELAVAANGVVFLADEAEVAFKGLQAACVDPAVAQVAKLDAGQALLINNRKGIHARSYFTATYQGDDRWLQRTYIRRTLWNIRDRADAGGRRLHR